MHFSKKEVRTNTTNTDILYIHYFDTNLPTIKLKSLTTNWYKKLMFIVTFLKPSFCSGNDIFRNYTA